MTCGFKNEQTACPLAKWHRMCHLLVIRDGSGSSEAVCRALTCTNTGGPRRARTTTYGLRGHCLGRWWSLVVVYGRVNVGIAHVSSVRVMVAACRQRSFCVLVVYWTQRSILAPVSARIWYRKVRHLGSLI